MIDYFVLDETCKTFGMSYTTFEEGILKSKFDCILPTPTLVYTHLIIMI